MKLKFRNLIKKFTWLDWLLVVLMFSFLGYLAISSVGSLFQKRTPVEYLASSVGPVDSNREIWVDVSGAVVLPGVYKLKAEARIKDALVAAGGISAEADRRFLAAEVNQAARVIDGMKIYIPSVETEGKVAGTTSERININSATVGELDGLVGIGQARAEEIIKNRPYTKIDDLVEKKVLSITVLNKIRDKIAVY